MVLKKGFTLVELLLVMTIIVVLAMIMVGILNPTALVNKGIDARRKKDLSRIKVAFEEYYNDKGCYPQMSLFADYECRGSFFNDWLNNFPCDPQGNRYLIATEQTACPKWYKVTTKLSNTKDADIPADWGTKANLWLGGALTVQNSNYGVSSGNVAWNEGMTDPNCDIHKNHYEELSCYLMLPGEGCQHAGSACSGDYCYVTYKTDVGTCAAQCKVPCCGQGCSQPPFNMYE